MKKYRILHVGPFPPPYSGLNISIRNFVDSFDNKDFIHFSFDTSTKVLPGQSDKIKLPSLKRVLRHFIIAIKIFIKVKKDDIDLVHFQGSAHDLSFLGNWISIVFIKLMHKKIIWHLHDDLSSGKVLFPGKSKFTNQIFKFCIKTCDVVAVLSPKNKNIVEKFVDYERIVVIPPCIKNSNIQKKKDNDNEIFKILYIGWLVKDKGIYDLIEIAKIIRQKNIKNITFDVLGIGMSEKETNEIFKKVEEDELKNIVYLRGLVIGKEKETYFEKSDLFFSPTYWDAFPLVILEAMSYGLPVLSTKVGGIPEIVNNSEGAILTEPGDIETMLKEILRLANDKNLCRKMGISNKMVFDAFYNPKVIADKTSEFYKKILSNI